MYRLEKCKDYYCNEIGSQVLAVKGWPNCDPYACKIEMCANFVILP